MKIELKAGESAELAPKLATDLLVIGVHTAKIDDKPKKAGKGAGKAAAASAAPTFEHSRLFRAVDEALGGALTAQATRDEFSGKANTAFSTATYGKLAARSVLVIGLGEKGKAKPSALRAFAARAARTANAEKAKSLALVAPAQDEATLRSLAEGVQLGAWRFTKYLTGDRAPKTRIEHVTFVVEEASSHHRHAVDVGEAVGKAVCLSRDLVSEPPNVLHAPELADRAAAMARESGLKVQVFDKAEIHKRGMNLLLAVNQGSTIEPRFVHITYAPRKKSAKKLVFVGKGLTFDSGGLCIKPADGMLDMKVDMSGAANVVGLMAAVAAVKPQIEIHGIFAATDNMPDGNAYRPGDVFSSLDGKSVEIINTDAEGRLVLADALAYARTLEPDLIIDNATLTGACMVALGNYCSGFYANREDLAHEIEKSAQEAGEQVWHMPLLDDLRDQLKSEIADLKHTGSRYGGSITAALFLREFVGDVPWAHFDIAGPVTIDKPVGFYVKGATGHPVLTFLRMIERAAAQH